MLVFLLVLSLPLEGDLEAIPDFLTGVPEACAGDGFGPLDGVASALARESLNSRSRSFKFRFLMTRLAASCNYKLHTGFSRPYR